MVIYPTDPIGKTSTDWVLQGIANCQGRSPEAPEAHKPVPSYFLTMWVWQANHSYWKINMVWEMVSRIHIPWHHKPIDGYKPTFGRFKPYCSAIIGEFETHSEQSGYQKPKISFIPKMESKWGAINGHSPQNSLIYVMLLWCRATDLLQWWEKTTPSCRNCLFYVNPIGIDRKCICKLCPILGGPLFLECHANHTSTVSNQFPKGQSY